MELYLIRHGIAEERRPEITDDKRALTKEGRQKTAKIALRLKKLNLNFDLILTSPLVRAYQTAEILVENGVGSRFEESQYLSPEGNLFDWVTQWFMKKDRAVMGQLALVGHEPCLGEWAEILVWGESKASLIVKKAGIIGIKIPDLGSPIGRSQMFWLTPPKYLL